MEFYTATAGGTLSPTALDVLTYPMGDATLTGFPSATTTDAQPRVAWIATPVPDWSLLHQWAQASRVTAPRAPRILVLPYLPSARGDHDVPNAATSNARLAAACDLTHLITADPHSPVWLDAFTAHSEATVIRLPVVDMIVAAVADDPRIDGVIAPDAGAHDRAAAAARALSVPLYTAGKHRDSTTGRLSGFHPPADLPTHGHYLIVDDICDGGGTFAGLAANIAGARLSLWVTHGGFTGPDHSASIMGSFANVFTTDSLPSAAAAAQRHSLIHVTPLMPYVGTAVATLN